MLDRSVRLPVAFLGILKYGAVYLPLDPTYPAARLSCGSPGPITTILRAGIKCIRLDQI